MPARRRVDLLLVEQGYAETAEKAAALVLAGKVTADGRTVAKPGTLVGADAVFGVVGPEPFVGRGGIKLDYALGAFGLDVAGKVAVDVGASTGGFTDCLLKRGAARVYAVDVGKGQLDWRLRRDHRVVPIEGINARYPFELPEPVDLGTMDVSFISVTKVIPSMARVAKREASLVVLVKPQFEAKRSEVGRGGVVRDPVVQARVLGRIVRWLVRNSFRLEGLVASPIAGASGNREFFLLIRSLQR